jgi:hypothetical protein
VKAIEALPTYGVEVANETADESGSLDEARDELSAARSSLEDSSDLSSPLGTLRVWVNKAKAGIGWRAGARQ